MEKSSSKPENIIDKESKNLIPKGPEALGLCPISHKDFNEYIKGKGFVGRNNYKLRDLKAMFGLKPLTYKNQATVTIDDGNHLNYYYLIIIIYYYLNSKSPDPTVIMKTIKSHEIKSDVW